MRTRRVTLSTVAAALLFAGGWAAGQASSSFSEDGPGWRAISRESKVFYVDGYDTGFRDGGLADTTNWLSRLLSATTAKQITQKQWNEVAAWNPQDGDGLTDKLSWTGWTATNITDAEIEEGMSRFYTNPANQAICWRNAFAIVSHSLAGQTFSETDMSAIHAMAAKSGCE